MSDDPHGYPTSCPDGNWAKLRRDQIDWRRRHGVARPEKGKTAEITSEKSPSSEGDPP